MMRWIIFLTVLSVLITYTSFKLSPFFLPHSKKLFFIFLPTFFFLTFGWEIFYRGKFLRSDSIWFSIWAWTASILIGIIINFLFFSLISDVFSFFWNKLFSSQSHDPDRRKVLFQWVLPGTLLGASTTMAALGFKQAIQGPEVQTHTVPIKGLPLELDGLKIAQISDLHVGPTIQKEYVSQVVQKVLDLKPDLIAITGDLADGTPEGLAEHLKPLALLTAPLGVYYVTGNHEYYWDAQSWIDQSKKLGFIPLLNENKILNWKGVSFLIGGVTDPSSHQFITEHKSDPHQAISSSEKYPFNLLLAHRPESCFEAEKAGFQLQLSGHTHAGQFFPWTLFISFFHKYYKGLNRHKRMWVYVNVGTGYWGPPHRFQMPSEITFLKITQEKV